MLFRVNRDQFQCDHASVARLIGSSHVYLRLWMIIVEYPLGQSSKVLRYREIVDSDVCQHAFKSLSVV